MKFTPKVSRQLGYYVYLYVNPLDNTIFYVGKGQGNRVFAHLEDTGESRKTETLRQIRAQGAEPRIEILIHGLENEMTALRIEAAVIDLMGVKTLSNQVRGWGSTIVGRMEVGQLMAIYDSEPVEIDEAALLIRINRLYRYGMSDLELYEATRGVWKVGRRREKVHYAFAVYKGIVREVYEVRQWFPAGTLPYQTRSEADVDRPGRWEFEGKVAEELIRSKYVDKSVESYFAPNSQNPITYVNC